MPTKEDLEYQLSILRPKNGDFIIAYYNENTSKDDLTVFIANLELAIDKIGRKNSVVLACVPNTNLLVHMSPEDLKKIGLQKIPRT